MNIQVVDRIKEVYFVIDSLTLIEKSWYFSKYKALYSSNRWNEIYNKTNKRFFVRKGIKNFPMTIETN